MAERTVRSCDPCGTEPADALLLNLGDGPRRIDLCTGCQDSAGLARLEALLGDYGIAGAGAPPVKKQRWPCPRCMYVGPVRNLTLTHLAVTHKLGMVEASRLVPPPGGGVACPDCGYLAQAGQGFMQHRVRKHGTVGAPGKSGKGT